MADNYFVLKNMMAPSILPESRQRRARLPDGKIDPEAKVTRSYMSDSKRRKPSHKKNRSGDFTSLPKPKLNGLFPSAMKQKELYHQLRKKGVEMKHPFVSTSKMPKITSEIRTTGHKEREIENPTLPMIEPRVRKIRSNKTSKLLNLNSTTERELIIEKYKYLITSPNISQERIKNFLVLIVRGLHYSLNCLKPPSKKFLNSRKLKLKDRDPKLKKTLYLDLDETIIYQCKQGEKATFEVDITETKEKLRFAARPYWQKFLDEVSKLFEIVVFTASTPYYAKLVCETLDPQNKYFAGILARTHCMMTKNGFFIKDLRMVDNRDLKDVVLLDNYVHSFAFNVDNGIPILEWRNQQDDDEFLHIIRYLKEVANCDDTMKFNRERLRLHEIPKTTTIN